nr:TetR family transcriptional regulator [Planotetraspora thailandica]
MAKSAGLAIGTLYRHFPRRVDLLLAVFEPKFGSFMATAASLRHAEAASRQYGIEARPRPPETGHLRVQVA